MDSNVRKTILENYLMKAFNLDWSQANIASEKIFKIIEVDELVKSKDFFTSSVSTLSYLFLRGVLGKDSYSECVLCEMEMYIYQLANLLRANKLPSFVREVIAYEMEEGVYDFSSFESGFDKFCEEMEGTLEDFREVRSFYCNIIDEINQRREGERE